MITHNIDEAEKICDNIGLLIYGKLLDPRTPQGLKGEHGSLYMLQVEVIIENDDIERSLNRVDIIIKEKMPFCNRNNEDR